MLESAPPRSAEGAYFMEAGHSRIEKGSLYACTQQSEEETQLPFAFETL